MNEHNIPVVTAFMDSPLGTLKLSKDGGELIGLDFTETPVKEQIPDVLLDCVVQLRAYFKGDLKKFSIPMKPAGTPFQLKVWQLLTEIPYGETVSYGSLSARLGMRNGARAVGLANGANPIPVIIPCHRVIGAGGRLTGYGGGLWRKEWLLRMEAAHLPSPGESNRQSHFSGGTLRLF
jgi:methylated-DNA-[protein]-cysteine S-methyltransferase